jgi:periplasmic copper chaperone A
MKRISIAAALATALALAIPAVAGAHVTVQPSTAAAGAFTRLDVRVPNEQDKASTTRVQLKLPDGFVFASYEPVSGWNVKVDKAKLAKPVKTDDGEVTEQVSAITWTAQGDQNGIPPGAFRDFGLSVQVPGKAGDKLTFKAVQTYSNGEVVRWIGPEGSNEPAPVVSVEAASDTGTAAPAKPASSSSSDSGSSDTLSIVALIVGIAGLAAGGAALASIRQRTGARV